MKSRMVVLGIYEYIIHIYLMFTIKFFKVFFYGFEKDKILPQSDGTTERVIALHLYTGMNV